MLFFWEWYRICIRNVIFYFFYGFCFVLQRGAHDALDLGVCKIVVFYGKLFTICVKEIM